MERITEAEALGLEASFPPPKLMRILLDSKERKGHGALADGLGEKKRERVLSALKPFYELAKSSFADAGDSGISVLLGEIAVIQDPRLMAETPYPSFKVGATPHYFASAIVSYVDNPAEPLLLTAWDTAIQELASAAKNNVDGIRMIVPHPETYEVPALVEKVKDIWGAVPWPEHPLAPDDAGGKKERRSEGTAELFAASLFRYRYPDPVSGGRPVDDCVAFFLRALVRSLFTMGQTEVQQRKAASLLQRLEQSVLFIVPFKRPRQGQHQLGTEPGGCLFQLIDFKRPLIGRMGAEFSQRMKEFVLRANWMLIQAALQESYEDIEVRNENQALLTTVTHFLPTDTGNMQHELYRALELAEKKGEASDLVRRYLRRAIEYSTRLDQAVFFALHAWKVGQAWDSPKYLEVSGITHRAEVFPFELGKVFTVSWEEVKEFVEGRYHDGDRYRVGIRRPVQVGPPPAIDSSSWRPLGDEVGEVRWAEQYVRTVCKEALLNAHTHGDGAGVIVKLGTDTQENEQYAWLEISNPLQLTSTVILRMDPEELAKKACDEPESHVGLSVFILAARAWNLPKPKFCVKDGRFLAKLYIGKVIAPQEGGP